MDLKETYDRIAGDWFKEHHRDTWWIEGTEKFVSLLPHGASVLDVGCGAGVKSQWLIDRGCAVTGVDFSEKMIGIARREVPAGTFLVMDMKDMGGLPGVFDGVFAQAVLLHVPKLEVPAAINGLRGKLKPGGHLYIAVKEQRPEGKEEEVLTEENYGYRYERFFSYFTLPEIRTYLAAAEMDICHERVVRSGQTVWIQVIARG